jgi:hypothetical protein
MDRIRKQKTQGRVDLNSTIKQLGPADIVPSSCRTQILFMSTWNTLTKTQVWSQPESCKYVSWPPEMERGVKPPRKVKEVGPRVFHMVSSPGLHSLLGGSPMPSLYLCTGPYLPETSHRALTYRSFLVCPTCRYFLMTLGGPGSISVQGWE